MLCGEVHVEGEAGDEGGEVFRKGLGLEERGEAVGEVQWGR